MNVILVFSVGLTPDSEYDDLPHLFGHSETEDNTDDNSDDEDDDYGGKEKRSSGTDFTKLNSTQRHNLVELKYSDELTFSD
jgi:hypothetical protein